MKELIDKLNGVYHLSRVDYQRDNLVFITIDKEKVTDLVTDLKTLEGFTHLVLLSCVDRIEEGLFQLTYLLNQPEKKFDIGVRAMIPRDDAVMVSIHHLWEQAATYQRELREMYGINFPGSPRVDENFILEGWDDIPPMRRDFDTLKYAEKTYAFREGRETHDPAAYMREKLYPNDPPTAQAKKDE